MICTPQLNALLKKFVFEIMNAQRRKYLVAGFINTVFGYSIGVVVYKIFYSNTNIFVIGCISNIISITFSFVTFKIFVFKTRGRWMAEYFRAYVVYGTIATAGVIFLWVYIDMLHLNIWIAQLLVILSTLVLSYIGHSRFTFREKT